MERTASIPNVSHFNDKVNKKIITENTKIGHGDGLVSQTFKLP